MNESIEFTPPGVLGMGEARAKPERLIIESERMRELYAFARRAATTHAPVLILGETGSGKEVLARFLHAASDRSSRLLRSVNCAALSPNLLEAALFGHERGAFTGAIKSSPGIFEQAQGGTVFLDEVGELSSAAQAALLRVLESGQLSRVGGERELHVDARVLTATNRDLEAMVGAGLFRRDLMYRLNAITLEIPALRERHEEILPLAQSFLEHAAARWGRPARTLASTTQATLLGYAWPGNIRQLRNVIERAVLLCDEAELEPRHLPTGVGERSENACATVERNLPARGPESLGLRAALRNYEARLIKRALEHTDGNRSRAAELLEIPRRTLTRKIKMLAS